MSLAPAEIDGRDGHRWARAIRARLNANFESRMSFLPPSSCAWRFDPIVRAVLFAINELNQAQLATVACACCYCASGRPFADEVGRGMVPRENPISRAPFAKKKPSRAARAKKAGAA